MWMIRATLALGLLAAPFAAVACSPPMPSISHAADASWVAYGVAKGKRWDQASSSLYVSVAVKHLRKGAAPRQIEAVSPCGLPIDSGDIVVVFKFGNRIVVYPAKAYEPVLGPTPAMPANSSSKPTPLRGAA